MYKRATINKPSDPVTVENEGPASLTGVAVVIAMIMLVIGGLYIMGNDENRNGEHTVTGQPKLQQQPQSDAGPNR